MCNSQQVAYFIFLLILIDQFSKEIIIKNWLSLVTLNSGGPFSAFAGDAYKVFALLLLLVLGAIFIYNYKMLKVFLVPFSMVIAGAISNTYDRFASGGVVDFIDLKIFPIFNIADIFITVGLLMSVIILITQEKK